VSVLVVGRGFLGRAIAAALGDAARLVAHDSIAEPSILDGVVRVVWAGRHPALGTPAWRIEEDLEPVLARRAAERGIAFTSLGTRKVYAPSPRPLREDDPLGPTDLYGRQKLALEERLAAIPGLRLTRLRIANVFGFERTPGRSSFLTRLLATLAAEGEVRLDVSPFTARDFLPVEVAACWIARLAREPPGGILNLGSGLGTPIGRLALWVIEGFGRGRLVVENPAERDGFVLAVDRLRTLLPDAWIDEAALRGAALALGHRLAAEA
jgi:nucleoside-diphosphate-sugar epimerase